MVSRASAGRSEIHGLEVGNPLRVSPPDVRGIDVNLNGVAVRVGDVKARDNGVVDDLADGDIVRRKVIAGCSKVVDRVADSERYVQQTRRRGRRFRAVFAEHHDGEVVVVAEREEVIGGLSQRAATGRPKTPL